MGDILVVNSGSSSLKYQVLRVGPVAAGGDFHRRASGTVERIGDSAGGRLTQHTEGLEAIELDRDVADHATALELMRETLRDHGPALVDLVAVGHRVVHGGARYTGPVLIDDDVEAEIARLAPLAPLHNPPNLHGIRALRAAYSDVPHVAVFDTAFHSTLPAEAFTYALPREVAAAHQIRRWGFQGTSDRYVTARAARTLDLPLEQVRLVVCHIGNGVSVTAVRDGRSVDTSMGMTPLEGAVMGTRSGDLDPAVVPYLVREAHLTLGQVEHLLTERSGLLGLCGDADMRSVRGRARAGDESARLALGVYAYRLRKYVAAYLGVLPGLHAVVFTGGVGEHDPELRRAVIGPLAHLGLSLHDASNDAAIGPSEPVRVDGGSGPVQVLVVPTDEEAEIAAQTAELALGRPVAQ